MFEMQHLFFRKFYIFRQNWLEMTICVHWLALSVLCFGSGEVPEWLQSKSVEPIWTALLNPKDLSRRVSKDPSQLKQPFLEDLNSRLWKMQIQKEQQNSSIQIREIRKKKFWISKVLIFYETTFESESAPWGEACWRKATNYKATQTVDSCAFLLLLANNLLKD